MKIMSPHRANTAMPRRALPRILHVMRCLTALNHPRHLRGATDRRNIMAWTTPAATDLRFGFEVTMYIANR